MPMGSRDRTLQSAWLSRSRAAGFTIVELLVVMVISSILAMSVVAVFVNQTRAMALNEDLVDLQQNLRVAMDMLHRDVRTAGAYVKDSIPVFVAGPFTYYYDEGGPDLTVALDSNGNPDALMLNYSVDSGLNVTIGTSTSASIKVCNDAGISTGELIIGNKLPVSNAGKVQLIDISNVQPVGGNCFNVVFAPGQSPVNNSSGISFNLAPDGKLWPNIQSLVFFVDLDFDGNGNPALMRGANNDAPSVVAFGITDLDVTYILANGTETSDVNDLGTLAQQLEIRRVRLEITGETRNAHNIGGANTKRTRTMTTEVLVRNLTF